MEGEVNNLNSDSTWTVFIRQLFICVGTIIIYFNYGLYFGAPTIFIPQIRRAANSTDAITLEMESWLSAAVAYSSVPWIIILPVLAYYYGRRIPSLVMWMFMTASAITLYFSSNVNEILISQILQGILPATTTVSALVLTEYTSPKYRGVFMTLKNATFFWGIWTANVIGTFFHWKVILVPIFTCCAITLTMVFWPESPYWLADKGRFEECTTAHRWLKGTNKEAEKELNQIIGVHMEKIKNRKESSSFKQSALKYLRIARSDVFYKPTLYGMMVSGLYIISGKLTCSIYSIGIINKMTKSEQAAYFGMLAVDGITIVGMYMGCAISKFVGRRTLLVWTSSVGAFFLFILSLYFFLINLNILSENKFISISFLTLFSMAISCGPVILGPCICGELAPLKYRSTFIAVNALLISLIIGTVIKLSPYAFEYLDLHWSFLIFACNTAVLTYLVYRYLPETKDKTLFEIQEQVTGTRLIVQEETTNMLPTDKDVEN
ncbi:unnamed protein product [Leptosia nina]|uniref:Major facilitator superfamily (MFS) profile domain-containing protein n=1 Tax=Leptosia nina TaxID=320188 RepID=A0AAV1JDY1_9NEOP